MCDVLFVNNFIRKYDSEVVMLVYSYFCKHEYTHQNEIFSQQIHENRDSDDYN